MIVTLVMLSVLPATQVGGTGSEVAPATGLWRAWLDSPGGELPFELELRCADQAWSGLLRNGSEEIRIPQVHWDGRELLLSMPHYDSEVRARPADGGRRLDGQWSKRGKGRRTQLDFHATAGRQRRFKPAKGPHQMRVFPNITGRWAVRFASAEQPAVGVFEQHAQGKVTGTFLTTTGDYRYLEGIYEYGRLRLSCFDGAHAFLFNARVQPDDSLVGDFWSRDTWHERWSAKRDDRAELPDALTQTTWDPGFDLATLRFPDLDGRLRPLGDPEFAGRARLIEIFGTWCPNCNDSVGHLLELQRKYQDRGLKVLGLAFEVTGTFARDAEQVQKFIEHHQVTFPILLAGQADKNTASQALPFLDKLRSYPTTLFVDAAGRIRAVHTGYAGPATGPAHEALRRRFQALVEQLLAE